jgi:hypothetical protein
MSKEKGNGQIYLTPLKMMTEEIASDGNKS